MNTPSFRRTIRRSTALLLLPLTLLVVQWSLYLQKRLNLVDAPIITVSRTIAIVVGTGAMLYLAGSCIAQLYSIAH